MITLRPEESSWTVECTASAGSGAPVGILGRRIPSEVPGCVHRDLIRAGVISAVDDLGGELQQQWVGHADWLWRGTIDVSAEALLEEEIEFIFNSIDTVARVELNGKLVGESLNQFAPVRLSVKESVRLGRNEISVAICAPVEYVLEQSRILGDRPVNGDWTPYPFIRKSACNFGWDWGPRVPTSGIPGAVRMECWSQARIEEVRPLVTLCESKRATVLVSVRVVQSTARKALATPDAAPPQPIAVRCELRNPPRAANFEAEQRAGKGKPKSKSGSKDSRPAKLIEIVPVAADGSAQVTFEVESPDRWWPRGIGRQPLYSLHVELVNAEGRSVSATGQKDRVVRRVGMRICELDRSEDEHGTQFQFRVNGAAIPITGANWIPASLFPCEGRDESTVDRLLDQAAAANLNMLRVWGGGIYEYDHFYDRCDEMGMLVWQDFMFACATYPEDGPLPAQVQREAEYQVARLCSHPSIVLWCGGNEDVIAWQSWGFRERLRPGQGWGFHYWSSMLQNICSELDPSRPYWTDSPWSGSIELHANDPAHGDRHTWDLKLAGYRSVIPRFTSEFGHQSPPTHRSLIEVFGEDELKIGSAALADRQRASGGCDAQYAPFLAAAFQPAEDFSQWLWQVHLLQARAMETAIKWLRAHGDRSGGSLFWQLNDVWTGHSWSIIDAKGRTKPAYHAVRRAAAPRLVTIEPVGVEDSSGKRSLRVVLVNDSPSKWNADVVVRRIDVHGRVLAEAVEKVLVLPRSIDWSLEVCDVVGAPADLLSEGIVIDVPTAGDEVAEELPIVDRERLRAWWWFAEDRDQPQVIPQYELSVGKSVADWWIRIHAKTLVRDLWVEPEGDWVTCTPNLVSLMPGERLHMMLKLRGEDGAAPRLRVHAH